MIHLRLRTEYSFRRVYGRVDKVIEAAGGSGCAITDDGTWGHVAFTKACKKVGVRPILGVEIAVVSDAISKKKEPPVMMAFLARNADGLREMYQLVTQAHRQFYYVPRIDYTQVNRVSSNIIIISGINADIPRIHPRPNFYIELNPTSAVWNRRVQSLKGYNRVVCADNVYPTPSDRTAYEVIAWKDAQKRTTAMHIPDEDELRFIIPEATDDDFLNTERIALDCDATLARARMVIPEHPASLRDMCMEGAAKRGLANVDRAIGPMWIPEIASYYEARLTRELDMITQKQFEDYFYVIADMVAYAKQHMLVGPARGSSCGSLVCYLLGITDIDPLVHDLMFERFIDVTRADLPDIDIDFQDTKRELVFEYLQSKYGKERVGRIGTILRYKAKSAIDVVARELKIPSWELKDFKGAIIERSSGDARAQFAIQDALTSLDIGKKIVEKYPGMMLAGKLEGHSQSSGTHAAGVIVCEEPLTNYAAIDRSGAAQVDKKDAEALSLLKIDVLGLRTLSVIQDTLDQIGKTREWLVTYPLDDKDAFEVLNAEKWSGIFQFEGYALQSLTRQMKIREFNDIVAITALARPGPLHCGAAAEFIERRIGEARVEYIHPLAEPCTSDSLGCIIYQEQVMAIGRAIGMLSWEDVSELRKAMSKTLGEEFFNRYWVKFEAGAASHGIASVEARRIWDKMCTFGSWAFNKSHAVAYGMVSYWCTVLKAHWPVEYAAACLRNPANEEQPVKILRELAKEGIQYVPVDPERSGVTWSVADGKLIGGLTNIAGIGEKKAQDIIHRRSTGKPLQPGQIKLLMVPKTPYDDIFECQRRFGDIFANPKKYKISSGGLTQLVDIQERGEYVFIAKLKEKKLRDMNEYGDVVKRGGRIIKRNNLFLNLVVEDDTGSIIVRISRFDYNKLGKPIIEQGKIGDYYLFKGRIMSDDWRLMMISKWRKLDEDFPLVENNGQ